jgi:hypothetical protein
LNIICNATGLSESKLNSSMLLEGATEKDLVYAGLEEVMSSATD